MGCRVRNDLTNKKIEKEKNSPVDENHTQFFQTFISM